MRTKSFFGKALLVLPILAFIGLFSPAQAGICLFGFGDCQEASPPPEPAPPPPPPAPPPPPPVPLWQQSVDNWPYRLPFSVYADLINSFCYPIDDANKTVDPEKCRIVSENCYQDYCGKCIRDHCGNGAQFPSYTSGSPPAGVDGTNLWAVYCYEDPMIDCNYVCYESKRMIQFVFPECQPRD